MQLTQTGKASWESASASCLSWLLLEPSPVPPLPAVRSQLSQLQACFPAWGLSLSIQIDVLQPLLLETSSGESMLCMGALGFAMRIRC